MATLKHRIKKKNISGGYDTLHVETNSNLVLMDNGNSLQHEMYNHTHTKSQITNFPTSMTPTTHNHIKSDITDFTHTHNISEIDNFPTTMDPTEHYHSMADITDIDEFYYAILDRSIHKVQYYNFTYVGNGVNGRTITLDASSMGYPNLIFITNPSKKIGVIGVYSITTTVCLPDTSRGYVEVDPVKGTIIRLYAGASGIDAVNASSTTYSVLCLAI